MGIADLSDGAGPWPSPPTDATRATLESVASPFHIRCMLGLALLGSGMFLSGMAMLGASGPSREAWLFAGLGIVDFALFFPWFLGLYAARHLLDSVRDLERRVADLEAGWKPAPPVDE